jgi:hypothetical protein
MSTATAPAWRVHLPTALETRVRSWARADPAGPWPSARAVSALLAEGATRAGRPRAVGAGRGLPLVAAQPLRWAGLELEVECRAAGDGLVECDLAAPPWDGIAAADATEDGWWELVDAFLAAVDARHGAIVDGEAVDPVEPSAESLRARLRRHLALLVPEHLATAAGADAAVYRTLPRSGRAVLLR